jgi:hypothetical protein
VFSGLVAYLSIAASVMLAYAAALPHLLVGRHRRKLRRMLPDELAAEARACAKSAGYERSFADALLFRRRRDWSQALLARAIDDLYAQAAQRDQREGNPTGPGSFVHDFYDFGLVHVREALDDRAPA